jgi:hypothetical protein
MIDITPYKAGSKWLLSVTLGDSDQYAIRIWTAGTASLLRMDPRYAGCLIPASILTELKSRDGIIGDPWAGSRGKVYNNSRSC